MTRSVMSSACADAMSASPFLTQAGREARPDEVVHHHGGLVLEDRVLPVLEALHRSAFLDVQLGVAEPLVPLDEILVLLGQPLVEVARPRRVLLGRDHPELLLASPGVVTFSVGPG